LLKNGIKAQIIARIYQLLILIAPLVDSPSSPYSFQFFISFTKIRGIGITNQHHNHLYHFYPKCKLHQNKPIIEMLIIIPFLFLHKICFRLFQSLYPILSATKLSEPIGCLETFESTSIPTISIS